MYRIPSTLNSDLDYTESLIKKYQAGDIKAGELKSNRVPMGIYEQRKNEHYMLRVRCAGGLITPKQLAEVAYVGRQVSTSHLHITTRQEIQIHNVDLRDTVPALRKLEKVGLSTAGGGGNTVRNMMVNDRSGLVAEEAFDVYPVVEELTSRLIAERDSFTMPRKYKVAMDYNEQDAHYSFVADFGLQARIVDGQRGYRVLIAGSTAPNPHTGWQVFDFLPEVDLYRAAKALKNWFNKYGNRRNRHKARMRYVFYKYGEEEAKRLYLEEFNELKKDGALDFFVPTLPLEHHRPDFAPEKDDSEEYLRWKRRYAHAQTTDEGKRENLWFAYLPVDHGNNRPEFFAEVADYLGNYGNDVIRFTKREQIQVRNIPEEYLPNIYHFFKRLGDYQVDYPVVVTNFTSCTGADTCRLGICLPKGAINAITKKLLASDLDLDAIPEFELKMNGCTNICANATWADLGFSGRIGRVGDDPFPAYTVWLPLKGRNEIDLSVGYIPARHLPGFVEDYLRDVRSSCLRNTSLSSPTPRSPRLITTGRMTRSLASSNMARQNARQDSSTSLNWIKTRLRRSARLSPLARPKTWRKSSTTSCSPKTVCSSSHVALTRAPTTTYTTASSKSSSPLASFLKSSACSLTVPATTSRSLTSSHLSMSLPTCSTNSTRVWTITCSSKQFRQQHSHSQLFLSYPLRRSPQHRQQHLLQRRQQPSLLRLMNLHPM